VERIVFGRCFVDMLEQEDGVTPIDWPLFDRTRPCGASRG
jgi:hypothetical protein